MNIIERAARAMHSNSNPEWRWDDPAFAQLRKQYMSNVRAVLLCIRDADEEMIGAANDLTDIKANIYPTGTEVWHTMIDIALDENEQ